MKRHYIVGFLTCLLVLMSVTTTAQLQVGADEQQKKKFSMTTKMFLDELHNNAFDPVKQEARRRVQRASMGQNAKIFLEPQKRSKNDGRLFAAPDTINGRAYVSAFITLDDNGDVSELEALGVQVHSKFKKGVITAEIPVDKISDVAALSNVNTISVARILRPFTNAARKSTNVDDILTQSANALRAGIENRYDGKGVLLGIIDSGIDFQHIAFKDKDGNSRIAAGYIWNGSEQQDYSINHISEATTDDATGDHGTHTASIAGGSSVIINGSNVTVTDKHANATFGGMAPGADLFLCGIKDYKDTYVANSFKRIVSYADRFGMPVVISNSYGGMLGTRTGMGDLQTIISQYFNDYNPNHICLFSTGNYAGNSKDNEGGGVHVYGEGSESYPLSTILRENIVNNADAGYRYSGLLAYAHARNSSTPLRCTIYVLDSSSGSVLATIPISRSGVVSGLDDYYDGDLNVYIGNDCLYMYSNDILETNSSHPITLSGGGQYWISNYTLAFDVYPQTGSAAIDVWGEDTYFTDHLRTEGHTWTAGNDDMSVVDEATYSDVISVGAYVSANYVKDYQGNGHSLENRFTLGDIAPFSSYAIADQSPTGEFYPWITAPGATVISAVNHYHKTNSYVDNKLENRQRYRVNNNTTNPYGNMEGTSMACPVAAGIVTLWLQAAKEKGLKLTTSDVKKIMAETAIRDNFVVGGINSTHFGNGKIDALAGLKKVLEKATIVEKPIVVTDLIIDNLTPDGSIDGTYLKGNLTLHNEDEVTKQESIKVILLDVETGIIRVKPIQVNIAPDETVTYGFQFTNLIVGHRYRVIVNYQSGAEFYRSDPMLCKDEDTGETYEGNENLAYYEYWFDKDYAKRKAVGIDGSKAVVRASIATDDLADGFHLLNFRVKNIDGEYPYSSVNTTPFLKLTKEQEGHLDYWIDDNRDVMKTLPLEDTEDEQLLELDLSDDAFCSPGFHRLNIQVATKGRVMGSVQSQGVLKLAKGVAGELEYWFDNDVKNRQKLTGKRSYADDGYIYISQLDLSALTPGQHRLNFRAVSSSGLTAGSVLSCTVMKLSTGKATQLEYWFDDDTANRYFLDGTADGDCYVYDYMLDMSDLPFGLHRLNIRPTSTDGSNKGSLVTSNVLKVGTGSVKTLEYWFDGDIAHSRTLGVQSGEGADFVFADDLNLNGIAPGHHRLYCRAIGDDPTTTTAIVSYAVVVKLRYGADGDATMASYSLTLDNDSVVAYGQLGAKSEVVFNYTLDASELAEGTHTLKATFWNSFGASVTDVTPFWVRGALDGDVNADGQVGIGDIVAITNYMAGMANGVTLEQADVNGDGEVGIGDIVAITNIMAGVTH